MELFEINPFVRFANKWAYIPIYKDFTLTYDYRLFFVTSGKISLIFENNSVLLEENQFVLIPPATKYMIEKIIDSEYFVLNFDMDFTNSTHSHPISPQSSETFDEREILSVNLYNTEPVLLSGCKNARRMLDEICQEYTAKNLFHNERISLLLKTIIVESTIYTQLDKTPKKVLEIKKYIEENLDKNITNQELGNKFGYHPNHINRLFKAHTQMSINQFITDVRLTKSADMINNTDLSITDISEQCGFCSSAYFIKKFKKKYGIPPLKFRNQKFNKI